MSELRQDPATKRWVIIASERARRPHQFVATANRAPVPEYDPSCPFCPGNEGKTPPEVYAVRSDGSADSPGWSVRVVPNRFAALSPDTPLEIRRPDICTSIGGYGAHEVIIEAPQHNLTLATMPRAHVEQVVAATLHRLTTLGRNRSFAYVAKFRNHGAAAGTSLVHPHSQIIATPIVPAEVRNEIEEARRFYDDRVHCVYCTIIAEEMEEGRRVVLEAPEYIVITPFASRFPFELMIIPREHASSFLMGHHQSTAWIAEALHRTVRLLYLAANNPDYNLVIHTTPLRDTCEDYYHWHVEVLPRLTTPAGFELGTGMYITTAVPEETAEYLRDFVPKVDEDP